MRLINLIFFFKQPLLNRSYKIPLVFTRKFVVPSIVNNSNVLNNIKFFNKWPEKEQSQFLVDMIIYENFLSESEEQHLLEEVEPYLKRMKYEFDHWDDAIHGFRETERKQWYPKNRLIIQKIADIAFNKQIMQYIHVLDLAADGIIKPHVDSSRYCGSTIAGMSLLTDSVMRLIRIDEKKYEQSTNVSEDYRNQSTNINISNENQFYADLLLKRRSLYIMKHTARYNFTHEILGNDNSIFNNIKIIKDRRISIICRNEPSPSKSIESQSECGQSKWSVGN